MFDSSRMATDMAMVLPVIILCVAASFILIMDSCFKRIWPAALNPVISLLVVVGIVTMMQLRGVMGEDGVAFAGGVVVDSLARGSTIALLITAALSILMAWTYLKNRGLEHAEYYVLLLFCIAGAILMAQANDLIVLFLGLETLSFALYVMAGFARTEEKSEEASIKYFLLGAFASAFLLYGIALVYGATQTTNLTDILRDLSSGGGRNPMMAAGIGLILVGLGFKAAVIPFHQWTPDVYEGAPTSVTAFMAGAAKIGAVAALIRVFSALAPVSGFWLSAVQILAILTMVFGNLLAIQQTNVKRLLAYSSIAHAGYLLVAVATLAHPGEAAESARNAAIFYMFAYSFMTLGAFGILIYLSGRNRDYQNLYDLRGLARQDPKAAYCMLFFLLSLGGIPPTMGFFGKVQIFYAAVQGHELTLAIVMGLSSVMAVYYYLRVAWVMCFEESKEPAPAAPVDRFPAWASVLVSAAATLIFGIMPGLIMSLVSR